MGKKVRVKWFPKNWAALRNSPEIRAELDRRASKIADAAGDGFTRRQAQPGTKGRMRRARASVGANTIAARRRQSEENVLQRAINAGRW